MRDVFHGPPSSACQTAPTPRKPRRSDVTPSAETPSLPRSGFVQQEVKQVEDDYAKIIEEMKAEGEQLIKEEERTDKAAALKQKGWQEFVDKWSVIKIPEIVGVEHQAVIMMAKDSVDEWAEKARNERQMTNGLGDLFTEVNVMTWRLESKASLLKQVQAKLQTEGLYEAAIDGEYGASSANAITAYQTAKGFPVSGKLDKITLDAMGINRTSEPAATVVVSRSSPSRGGGSNTQREPQAYEKAAGWVNAFAPLAGKIGPPRFP